ncbi:MAG: hypothetical protein HY429_02245, partial [Candidatus Levybacteria bacterium]|nr:hypothetical protein [Candidatus Levybacteria bacterium]
MKRLFIVLLALAFLLSSFTMVNAAGKKVTPTPKKTITSQQKTTKTAKKPVKPKKQTKKKTTKKSKPI